MALIDELKERRAEVVAELETQEAFVVAHQTCVEDKRTEIADLDRAIAALEPPPAAVTEPEPEPEPQDDASEFSEEGYAPVVDLEPAPLIDAQTCEPGEPDIPALIASGEHSYDEVAAIAYPEEPTKPEADALAKALDHYDPKAMADRNRFNPFAMFRKEGDQ